MKKLIQIWTKLIDYIKSDTDDYVKVDTLPPSILNDMEGFIKHFFDIYVDKNDDKHIGVSLKKQK